MKRSLRIAAAVTVVVAVAGLAMLYSLFEASQQVPAFYREAVARNPGEQQVARDEFVAETTALASDVRRAGRWQHVFTSEQINAWLALELAANYPELLAGEWHDPRIDIGEHEATIACRYDNGSISTVLSLSVDVYLHAPNVIALRIRRARAGALPVPLAQVLDAVSQVARELKLRLEWRKASGDPVALVTFPPPRDSQTAAVRLETVELRKGELFVAGAMGRGDRLAEVPAAPAPADAPSEPGAADQPLVGAAEKETRHN
jgi:hypothetical protein